MGQVIGDLWQATVTGQPHDCEPWKLVDGAVSLAYYGRSDVVAQRQHQHCLCGAYRQSYELSTRPATDEDRRQARVGLMPVVFA